MNLKKLKYTKNIVISGLHSANLLGDDIEFKKLYNKYPLDYFESHGFIDDLSIAESVVLFANTDILEFFLKNNSNPDNLSDYAFRDRCNIYASIIDSFEKYQILNRYKVLDGKNLSNVIASNIAPSSLELVRKNNKTELNVGNVTEDWISTLNKRFSYITNMGLETTEQLETKFIKSVSLLCGVPDDIFKIKISLIYGLILGEVYGNSRNVNQHKIYDLLIKTGFLDTENNLLDELKKTINNLSSNTQEKEFFSAYKKDLSNKTYANTFDIEKLIKDKGTFRYKESELIGFEKFFLNLSIKNNNKNSAAFKL